MSAMLGEVTVSATLEEVPVLAMLEEVLVLAPLASDLMCVFVSSWIRASRLCANWESSHPGNRTMHGAGAPAEPLDDGAV